MCKIIEIDFSAYKSKKNSVAPNNTNKDIYDFISEYENDYIEFYAELKQKDPTLYNYLKKTATPNAVNKLVFGKA